MENHLLIHLREITGFQKEMEKRKYKENQVDKILKIIFFVFADVKKLKITSIPKHY